VMVMFEEDARCCWDSASREDLMNSTKRSCRRFAVRRFEHTHRSPAE
jgi:hypothetical protein